jgi:hypothetical protein
MVMLVVPPTPIDVAPNALVTAGAVLLVTVRVAGLEVAVGALSNVPANAGLVYAATVADVTIEITVQLPPGSRVSADMPSVLPPAAPPTSVALDAKRINDEKDEKHARDIDLVRTHLQNEILIRDLMLAQSPLMFQQQQPLQFLPQQQQQQQFHPLPLPLTVTEWLTTNLYGQTLSLTNFVRGNQQDAFRNPNISLARLLEKVTVEFHGSGLRIMIPLTYRYPLRSILSKLAEVPDRNQLKQAIRAITIPQGYSIVLFNTTDEYNEDRILNHRKNCDNIMLHLHLIVKSKLLPQNKWKFILIPEEAPRQICSIDVLDRFYPAFFHFGPGSYLSHNLGLRAEYRTAAQVKKTSGSSASGAGLGTGNGKTCPFCLAIERLSKTNSCQVSHHPNTCPTLALLSDNEAEILLVIREACKASLDNPTDANDPDNRPLHELKYFFGVRGKDPLLYLDSHTFLRFATQEELANGQNVNGIRLNLETHKTLRMNTRKRFTDQLYSPLFGPLDQSLSPIYNALFDVRANDGDLPIEVRKLFHDGFPDDDTLPPATYFMDRRYNELTRKPVFELDAVERIRFELNTLVTSTPSSLQQKWKNFQDLQESAEHHFLYPDAERYRNFVNVSNEFQNVNLFHNEQ